MGSDVVSLNPLICQRVTATTLFKRKTFLEEMRCIQSLSTLDTKFFLQNGLVYTDEENWFRQKEEVTNK